MKTATWYSHRQLMRKLLSDTQCANCPDPLEAHIDKAASSEGEDVDDWPTLQWADCRICGCQYWNRYRSMPQAKRKPVVSAANPQGGETTIAMIHHLATAMNAESRCPKCGEFVAIKVTWCDGKEAFWRACSHHRQDNIFDEHLLFTCPNCGGWTIGPTYEQQQRQ